MILCRTGEEPVGAEIMPGFDICLSVFAGVRIQRFRARGVEMEISPAGNGNVRLKAAVFDRN